MGVRQSSHQQGAIQLPEVLPLRRDDLPSLGHESTAASLPETLSLPGPLNRNRETVPSQSDDLRQLVNLHSRFAANNLQDGLSGEHIGQAGHYLERLTRDFPGHPDTHAAHAEFHVVSAGLSSSPTERQSNWQQALRSLEQLRTQHPSDPATTETLVSLARHAFEQASHQRVD